MSGIKLDYLKANDNVLLSTAPDKWYALKVLDTSPIVLDYSPLTQISGFEPLNVFQGGAEDGFNNYVVDKVELAMQEFTNITNIFDADNMKIVNQNYLLQIYMGISPSPLRIFRYYPSNDALNNYLKGNAVHWGGREKNYGIGYIDGFMSPKNEPSKEGEFYMLPTYSMEFTFMNPVFVPAYPDLRFYINQMKVEPADSSTAFNMLNRKIPARIVNTGAFPDGFEPREKIYGVDAVPLTASENDLKESGY